MLEADIKEGKNINSLRVCQRAHQLVLKIYEITKKFPDEEVNGLSLQLRQSSISVTANIIEGLNRKRDVEYTNFLNAAEGCLEKTKYYVSLSNVLGYIDSEDYGKLIPLSEDVGRMLTGLYRKPNREV